MAVPGMPPLMMRVRSRSVGALRNEPLPSATDGTAFPSAPWHVEQCARYRRRPDRRRPRHRGPERPALRPSSRSTRALTGAIVSAMVDACRSATDSRDGRLRTGFFGVVPKPSVGSVAPFFVTTTGMPFAVMSSRRSAAASTRIGRESECLVQRRQTLLVLRVQLGASLDEKPDERLRPALGGAMQRRISLVVRPVDVGASRQAHLHELDRILLRPPL